MSYDLIGQALDKHLLAMPGLLPTAWENDVYEPVDGVAYQRCSILWASPVSDTMGRLLTKENGLLQVVLLYPTGDGAGDAMRMAVQIRQWFKPPMVLVEGGLKIQVIDPARVSPGYPSGGRYAVPISIPWMAYVSG